MRTHSASLHGYVALPLASYLVGLVRSVMAFADRVSTAIKILGTWCWTVQRWLGWFLVSSSFFLFLHFSRFFSFSLIKWIYNKHGRYWMTSISCYINGCSSKQSPWVYFIHNCTSSTPFFCISLWTPQLSLPPPPLSDLFFYYVLFLSWEGFDSTQVLQCVSSYENGRCSSRPSLHPSASPWWPRRSSPTLALARPSLPTPSLYALLLERYMAACKCLTCYRRTERTCIWSFYYYCLLLLVCTYIYSHTLLFLIQFFFLLLKIHVSTNIFSTNCKSVTTYARAMRSSSNWTLWSVRMSLSLSSSRCYPSFCSSPSLPHTLIEWTYHVSAHAFGLHHKHKSWYIFLSSPLR